MKKLKFEYRMELSFSSPVTDQHFTLRCLPQDSERQTIEVGECLIGPADSMAEMMDGFGNHRVSGCCIRPHEKFGYCVRGTARTEGMKIVREPFHPMYKFPSAYTKPSEELRQFAREIACQYSGQLSREEKAAGSREGQLTCEEKAAASRGVQPAPQGKEAIRLALAVMQAVYEKIVYVRGVTTIHTTAAEAFAMGKGVCQDFAHIMIVLLRELGIPARYVNGLMIGEGATHAWVELYTGEGWYGLDPTNNLHIDEYYIKFAHGRDYGDCVVDKGIFIGKAAQEQKIYVNVEECKE